MKVNSETSKHIEMEFRDLLAVIFTGSKKLIDRRYTEVQQNNRKDDGTPPRFNYERDAIELVKKYDIYFNGRKLASTRCKPHKKVTVYAFFDEDHYVQKIFERVLYTYLPEVRVETVNYE